jgi:hypothetical protein
LSSKETLKEITYAEQIDYKTILLKQIEFIHEGIQLGNQNAINNGILSFELLLYPKLDEDTFKKISKLNEDTVSEIKKLNPSSNPKKRGDIEKQVANLNYELQKQKYRLLLKFCETKDLLLAEVETETL